MRNTNIKDASFIPRDSFYVWLELMNLCMKCAVCIEKMQNRSRLLLAALPAPGQKAGSAPLKPAGKKALPVRQARLT